MEHKYYLSVEVRPNNYFPINLKDIKIFNTNTNDIAQIDALTHNFTKAEIIKAIEETNIMDIKDNTNLVIIYNEKNRTRKVEVLTKDINFDMWQNIKDNYQDKNYCNKIINFLNGKISDEELNLLKAHKGEVEFLNIISGLPYFTTRKLYFYLYEK